MFFYLSKIDFVYLLKILCKFKKYKFLEMEQQFKNNNNNNLLLLEYNYKIAFEFLVVLDFIISYYNLNIIIMFQ